MINSGIFERATFNVSFSYLVKAKRKTHALGVADFQFNEKNILLDRVKLVNEHGIEKILVVERVESIRWTSVESSEYSNLFNVVGHIRLTLCIDMNTEKNEGTLWKTVYRLPKSVLQDKTVWVIPTSYEPVFTQVLSQSLELSAESIESTKVG